jgi:ABC-type uncharacterized transport system permease subunit
MTIIVLSAIASFIYLSVGSVIGVRLIKGIQSPTGNRLMLSLGSIAIVLHAVVLYHNVFTPTGVNLGFFNALSLLSGLIVLLLLIAAVSAPVENLGIAIFPLAGIAMVLEMFFPSHRILNEAEAIKLEAHILISILAYSVLSIAAVQAILLAIQNKQLHDRRLLGFVRALPPLETMENFMFQMIGLGFFLQSLSLISGILFLKDMFAQHLAHKTILSIAAWLVYAILLWGRWRHGWRGKTAIRWTLSGFASLLLAYFGSKLVLELILKR